jgi:hypothetical protein
VSAVQSRDEAGLGVLSLVLWAGVRAVFVAAIFRQAVHRTVPESQVQPKALDAVHAVLSLVPAEGATEMEGSRVGAHVWTLWLGRGFRVLVSMPLVLQASWRTMRKLSAISGQLVGKN